MKFLTICMLFAISFLSGCYAEDTEKKYELKSPCVAADDNGKNTSQKAPCVRRKVNDNWMS